MNESVDPSSNPPPFDLTQIKTPGTAPSYTDQTSDSKDDGEMHKIYGMEMNKKEYDQFMKNLSNSIIDQIKADEAQYTKTQQEIREQEQMDEG